MDFPDWKLALLLLLALNEHHSFIPHPSSSPQSKRNQCLALVAKRHFKRNSTVAFLTTEPVRRDSNGIDSKVY